MSIVAMAIYGSVARGDNVATSDVDMMSVLTGSPAKKIDRGNVNMSFFNQDDLVVAASRGDLFVYHLILEAKFIYDEVGFEERLRTSFRKSLSYARQIYDASSLGWFLAQKADFFEEAFIMNRRAAWCVRTILISKSVERNSPAFSASALFEQFPSPEAKEIMSRKDSNIRNSNLEHDLSIFLKQYGDPKTEFMREISLTEQLRTFRVSENKVAQSTATALMHGSLNPYGE